jgi:peptide/nickel transport system permease protein
VASTDTGADFTLDTAAELAAKESGGGIEGKSPWVLAWRRLRRNWVGLGALAVFLLVVLACFFAPLYAHHVSHLGENEQNVGGTITINGKKVQVVSSGGVTTGPNGQLIVKPGGVPIGPQWWHAGGKYVLGADSLGRDIATRILYGGRNSLQVGIISAIICSFFSIVLALLAGYYGGAPDWIISRSFDLIWAFPVILLGIALGTALAVDGFHHFGINLSGSRSRSSSSPTSRVRFVVRSFLCGSRSSSTPRSPRARARCA